MLRLHSVTGTNGSTPSLLSSARPGLEPRFANARAPIQDTEDGINSVGLGFRYYVLKEHNAWIGTDHARGSEDDYFYIQVRQSW